MKPLHLLSLVLLACSLALPSVKAGNIPEAYPAQRYESLGKHNPFTLSSIADDSVALSGLAERFSLGGAFTIGSQDYVFLINKTNPQERLLISQKPNEQGIVLESLVYDAIPEKTVAKIRLGEESGTIGYDPSQIKITAAAGAPPSVTPAPVVQQRPMPNYNSNNNNMQRQQFRRPRVIAPPPATTPTKP